MRSPWLVAPALLVAALASCRTAAPPPAPLPSPSPAPSQPPAARLDSLSKADVERLAATVAPQVEALRGLRFARPVPVEMVSDAAARAHFIERGKRFDSDEETRVQQRALQQLGLLPAGYDITKGVLDMLEEQVGGYYDPETGKFYVLDDMPRSSASLLMAHELTHALDDQRYGIDRLLTAVKDDDDRESAIGALVEGSGTLVMSVFLVHELGSGRMTADDLRELQESESGKASRMRAAPPFLQRGLLSSYLLGQSFLLRGNLAGLAAGVPAADVDRAFASPPVSTEQILHPEKYWDPAKLDLPKPVPVPDLAGALGGGWTLAGRGSLGELGLAIMTGLPGVDASDPASAVASSWTTVPAAGWGGDVFQVYGRGTQAITLLATVWDTERDAVEFAQATSSASRLVRREGSAVVVVAGDEPKRREALAGPALRALAPGRPAAAQ